MTAKEAKAAYIDLVKLGDKIPATIPAHYVRYLQSIIRYARKHNPTH